MELEGNAEMGNAEMGNAEMENAEMENAETGNEDDVETGSDEKDEDQVVWEKLFDGGNLPQKWHYLHILTPRRPHDDTAEPSSKEAKMDASQPNRVFLLSSDVFTTDITQSIQQLGGVVIDSHK